MMHQLSLELSALQTVEYPDLYRGHRLIARQKYKTYADRLGNYRALTWHCWSYGPHADGVQLAIDWQRPEEAIAAAMQWLDVFVGNLDNGDRNAGLYDAALKRIVKRLEQGK